MAESSRPLSPHLQVYRPQITSMLSILHRLTGVALGLGFLLLAWWLIAAAVGPGAYGTAQAVLGSWLGTVVLIGFSFALMYHLCNGIRHLAWDAGFGFELKTVTLSGVTVVIASLVLTVIAFVLAYGWRA